MMTSMLLFPYTRPNPRRTYFIRIILSFVKMNYRPALSSLMTGTGESIFTPSRLMRKVVAFSGYRMAQPFDILRKVSAVPVGLQVRQYSASPPKYKCCAILAMCLTQMMNMMFSYSILGLGLIFHSRISSKHSRISSNH